MIIDILFFFTLWTDRKQDRPNPGFDEASNFIPSARLRYKEKHASHLLINPGRCNLAYSVR